MRFGPNNIDAPYAIQTTDYIAVSQRTWPHKFPNVMLETLKHHLSTVYRQFMLVYEDCRHEESTPQVRAMERAFKRSSEGQRLNKLIREKNVDGFLPRSVGAYMNAAEGLASKAEAALRKARSYWQGFSTRSGRKAETAGLLL